MADADLVERAKAEILRRRAMKELQRRQELKAQQPAEQTKEGFDYGILPIHADADGTARFSSDAGILGGIKRSMMLGGDVMSGRVPVTDTSGRTSPELIERSLEAATTFSPAAMPLAAGEKMFPGVAKNLVADVPDAAAIKQTAQDGYRAAQELGVEFSPQAVKDMATDANLKLYDEGFLDDNASKARSVLDKLSNPPVAAADETVSVPLTSVEVARRRLNKTANNPNDSEAAEGARIARDKVDRFLREPPEGSVVTGDALAASRLYREADQNYRAAKRSEAITNAEHNAELDAWKSNSGRNVDNSTRAIVRALLKSPKESARFTAEERDALEGVVKGTKAENAARYTANLLGGGGGLGSAVTSGGVALGGALSGNPQLAAAGLIPGLGGPLLKELSAALTKRHLSRVEEDIRATSPLAKEQPRDVPIRDSAREKIMRALMIAPQEMDPAFWEKYLAGEAT